MLIRWWLERFIEPGFHLAPEDRKKIVLRSSERMNRDPANVVIAIILVLVLMGSMYLIGTLFGKRGPLAVLLLMLGVVIVWAGFAFAVLGHLVAQPACRRAMSDCGLPVCVRCGRDLREVDWRRCPACGTERYDLRADEPSREAAKPRRRWLQLVRGQLIDARFDLPPEERKEISKRAHALMKRQPMYWAINAITWLSAALASVLLLVAGQWLRTVLGSVDLVMFIMLAFIVVLVPTAVAAVTATIRTVLAPPIRQAMCEHGVTVCMDCGCDLRSSEGETCPGCGAARRERAADQPVSHDG